jgi:hypothetical protein
MVRIFPSWWYNLSTRSVEGGGNVSTHCPPLVADGGSHSLDLSSSGSEVHHQDPLCLEHMLLSRQFIQLGHHDRLLAGELASPLHYLTLTVGLLSVGLRSLPLLKGMPSLGREPDVLPWCEGPRQNCHHGLKGWNVLQPWCGCDGGRWCPHTMPLGDREAGAPLPARGHVELVGGVLEDGS